MAIINNNVQNVKFLRNGQVFESHDIAYNALTGFTLTDEQDGTAILARYTASDNNVKTLVGWVYFADASNKSITIFDIEGASGDVEALRQEINAKLGNGVSSGAGETVSEQLAALSGTAQDTSASTSVAGARAYAKDYTDEQIGNLEYTGVTTGDAVVVTNVTESDGIVSAVTANVGGLKLTDYSKGSDSGAVEATDSINEGFSKVENQIDAVNDKIDNAISGLDYSDTAVAKKFVIEVDETDGVIAVQRGTISSSAGTIVLNDNTDGGVDFDVNIDGTSIVKNANGVLSVASTALTQYSGDTITIDVSAANANNNKTISSLLTIEEVTTSVPDTVAHRYQLAGSNSVKIGEYIDIPKDSALVDFYLGHVDDLLQGTTAQTEEGDSATVVAGTGDTALVWIMQLNDGKYKLTAVDVHSFIDEAEFASGVTWDSTAKKVIGVVDGNSEVDSNGDAFLTVGADGFKIDGIKDEIAAQLGDVVENLDATVTGSTSGSHITISIEELDGKLVQSGLTIQEDNIADADDLAELSGKAVTEIASSNASISATSAATTDGTVGYDLVTDASKIKMSGFTADTSAFTAITEASTVTEAVKAIETEILANEETVAASLNDINTRIDTVSGDVETISGKVDTIETNYISGVSVNGSEVTVTDHVAPISITAATSATTASTANAIVVDTDANGNITLGLNYIDCGFYN